MAGPLSSIASKLFGGQPTIPKIPKLDLAKEQQGAIDANKAALPGAQGLASSINQFNQDEWLKAIKFAFPDFDSARDQVQQNIGSQLRGEIPIGDRNLLQIKDAAKAFSGGYSGSGQHGALVARDLGTTTLNVMNQGQNALQSWLSTVKAPGQFDVSSMFITPGQKYQTTNEQNMQQFQRKYAASVNDANFSWGNTFGPLLDTAAGGAMAFAGGGAGMGGLGALSSLSSFGSQNNATQSAQDWWKQGQT